MILCATGLKKRYGEIDALNGVDFEARRGETVAVVGPNGAGKTTLLSILAGLVRADAGEARFEGTPVTSLSSAQRGRIGLAPQETGVYPRLTVRENLAFFGGLASLRAQGLASAINEVVAALLLGELLDRPAGRLSGGERRRLHIAAALIARPALALLDEATVGADVNTRRALIDAVRAIAAAGTAVIYSTHYLGEVEDLGGDVAIIDGGRIVVRDAVHRLVAEHGRGSLDIHFFGEAPELTVVTVDGALAVHRHDQKLTVQTQVPLAVLPVVLGNLSDGSRDRVRSIDVSQPDLESAFVKLTGRSLDPAREGGETRR